MDKQKVIDTWEKELSRLKKMADLLEKRIENEPEHSKELRVISTCIIDETKELYEYKNN